MGFYTLHKFRCSKKLENITFLKLGLFPSSDEGETLTLLGPLERANLNHWTTYVSIATATELLEPSLCQWKLTEKCKINFMITHEHA
jgi:hypothetical protein